MNITTPEPESEHEPEPEERIISGLGVSPEPKPDFDIAQDIWGAAWPFHVYIFAIIFTVLAFYNLNSILGLMRSRKGAIRRKKIFIATNIMLLFFNFITAIHLYIYPYEYPEHFQIKYPGLLFIFSGMRLPCLTASFSFILITLIETSKVQLYSKKLQNIWYLLAVICTHFIIVVTIHLYLVFHQDKYQFIAICQMFYILFGVVVSCMVFYCYLKLKQQLLQEEAFFNTNVYRSFRFGKGKKRKKKDTEIELDGMENDTQQTLSIPETVQLIKPRSPFVDRSLNRLFKVATLISISGMLYCTAVLYSFCSMLANTSIVLEPWPWLAHQTISRLAEVCMVVGMSYLVRRSFINCCEVDERTRTDTVTISQSQS